jgi:hypothetical protein
MTMTNTSTLLLVTGDSNATGLVCGWSGGNPVSHEVFAKACEAAGLLPPSRISLASALARACRDAAGKDRLSRAYAAPGETKRRRGRRALVDESVVGRDLAYSVAIRAEVTSDGADIAVYDAHDQPIGAWHPQAAQAEALIAAIREHEATLSADDVKAWIRETICGLYAGIGVLREAGGTYYCPPRFAPQVRQIKALVRELADVRVNLLPAVTSDADAVETILAGVAAEVSDALAAADAQCVKGARSTTFAKHEDLLGAVEKKVRAYEALLNTQAADLRSKLDSMQTRIAAAALGQFDFGGIDFGGATFGAVAASAAEEE